MPSLTGRDRQSGEMTPEQYRKYKIALQQQQESYRALYGPGELTREDQRGHSRQLREALGITPDIQEARPSEFRSRVTPRVGYGTAITPRHPAEYQVGQVQMPPERELVVGTPEMQPKPVRRRHGGHELVIGAPRMRRKKRDSWLADQEQVASVTSSIVNKASAEETPDMIPYSAMPLDFRAEYEAAGNAPPAGWDPGQLEAREWELLARLAEKGYDERRGEKKKRKTARRRRRSKDRYAKR